MKTMKTLFVTAMLLVGTMASAQWSVDADFRMRDEYRHGFKTLLLDGADGTNAVSQRSRINTKYVEGDLTVFAAFQNIRTWGDVGQLNFNDVNGISTHQAWAQFKLMDNLYMRAGRQEIVLDDARIMGNVDWAQQGRSHDGAVLKYAKDNHKFDLGYTFRAGAQIAPDDLQYAWYNYKKDALSASFLFLNNGKRNVDNDMLYSQTVGTYLKYGTGDLSLNGSFYYQMGDDGAGNDLNAYQTSLNVKYQLGKMYVGVGGELLSGNDDGVVANGVNNAFTPFYGTNHKFNGTMDYFYVGNHANSIGLRDLQFNMGYKINDKALIKADFHNFASAASYTNAALGNELDITFVMKVQKDVTLKAGYSHMMAVQGLMDIKGVATPDPVQNWGWVMIVVNPNLFTSSK